MDTKHRSSTKLLIAIGVIGGSVAFFIGSLRFAWQARHYQISGQPMPNGKGGFMTYGDGYLIAIVLLLFSVACIITARRLFRAR